AGCAHYIKPTEGVRPEDMIRHTLGEDLKVGANLTWGPGFDYQKQFFTGRDHAVSRPSHLLHYDVEVSGFGSHHSGHLVLLRLKEQIPPGGDSYLHWPTLGLNTLRWAKRQGAVCGPAHSGWGLGVDSTELPNYLVPPYNGIGANEYIVDVTHEVPGPDGSPVPAVDFLSTVDTPYAGELNIWYHTLNVGFRTRIAGETDFPCVSGDRVGMGRSYVKLDGPLEYPAWCEGLRRGRAYVSEGKSHLLELRVNEVPVGERRSELRLRRAGTVRVKLKAAGLLPERPGSDRGLRPDFFWDLERARIGQTRNVTVEVVVNGFPVASETLVADGALRDLTFDVPIARSSWVAVRILPSSHTNPVWVLVGGRPVRVSRRSAEWCLKGVDQCWSQKERFIAAAERKQAVADYEHARRTYRRLLAECDVD
ncbi:MAG TPA: CehA/McbA family metallohydrolase, partial [Gemmatimonadales bacterium]